MRWLVSTLGALLAICSASLATAQTVPITFWGMNDGVDWSTKLPPMYSSSLRIWHGNYMGTSASWPTMETSNGVYNWVQLDGMIAVAQAAKTGVTFTLGAVPSWVNSSNCLSTSAMQQEFYAFVTALYAHEGAGQIQRLETWNEFNSGSTWWTCGTAQNDSLMAQMAAEVYSIAHATDPNVIVLSPSVTPAGDTTGNQVPNTYLWHVDRFLQNVAANGSKAFDRYNYHGYPQTLTGTSVSGTDQQTAPELTVNGFNSISAVLAADGFGSYPIEVDEGNISASPFTFSMDSAYQAGIQTRYLILLASLGVSHQEFYVYVPACTQPCSPTLVGGNSQGLNATGAAYRVIQGWISGATFTSPMARTVGTNLIRTAPNDASAAIGLLSGPGGCTGAPSGTGSLPTHWSLANPDSGAGMSVYVVGTGTDSSGIPYITIRICGTDTTAGSGSVQVGLQLEASTQIAATLAQNFTYGVYHAQVAGSNNGLYSIIPKLYEYSSGGSYLGFSGSYWPYPVNQPLKAQKVELRIPTTQSTVAYVAPSWNFLYYYNSTSPIAIDVTYNIGGPYLDTGANQWTGAITGVDGASRIIAWDATLGSSNYNVPNGYTYYRDLNNNIHTITGGSVTLTNSPILLEKTAWSSNPSL